MVQVKEEIFPMPRLPVLMKLDELFLSGYSKAFCIGTYEFHNEVRGTHNSDLVKAVDQGRHPRKGESQRKNKNRAGEPQ